MKEIQSFFLWSKDIAEWSKIIIKKFQKSEEKQGFSSQATESQL